jgi:hypothetical protein
VRKLDEPSSRCSENPPYALRISSPFIGLYVFAGDLADIGVLALLDEGGIVQVVIQLDVAGPPPWPAAFSRLGGNAKPKSSGTVHLKEIFSAMLAVRAAKGPP